MSAGNSRRKRRDNQQVRNVSERTSRRKDARHGKSYLDRLPNVVIENIIRFTSTRPREQNWKAHVPPQLAVCLLNSDSVLSSVSRNLFRSLQAGGVRTGHETSLAVVGSLAHRRRHFPRLMSALRETLIELRIDRSSFPPWLTRSLICKCPQLKRLSLGLLDNFPLTDVLSSQGGNLGALAIAKPWFHEHDVSAIAEFGRRLKIFSLSVYNVCIQMDTLWKSIGETLERTVCSQGKGRRGCSNQA